MHAILYLFLYVSLDVQDETACDIHRHDFSAVSFFHHVHLFLFIIIYCGVYKEQYIQQVICYQTIIKKKPYDINLFLQFCVLY